MSWRATVGLLMLAAVTGGCALGSSGKNPKTASQALAQARRDGFTGVRRLSEPSWKCTDTEWETWGPVNPTGTRWKGFVRPDYGVSLHMPGTPANTSIIALITVLPSAQMASTCARGAIYTAQHTPGHHLFSSKTLPYRMVWPDTVETDWSKSGTGGDYQINFADGRVLASGVGTDAGIAAALRRQLARYAAQVAS